MKLATILFVSSLAFGQTKIDPGRQVRPTCPGATVPTIWLNNGTGVMVCVAIDGVTLKITNGVLSAVLPSIGSTAITVNEETPTGPIDGINATFTLAFPPNAGTLELYVNGIRQRSIQVPGGPAPDYSLNGSVITFNGGSVPGATLPVTSIIAKYQHQ